MEIENNYNRFGSLKLFKFLLLQFLEDLSNRELESDLKENVIEKWLCSFEITD